MTILNKRNFLKLALATTALAAVQPSFAQDAYPSRTITLIVPFAAGGVTDLTARIYANALSEQLGQPVVVDNKPGAGGTTGGGMVADAAADGYTLLWSGSSLVALAPILYPELSYNIATAFQPISRIMTHTLMLAINAGVPATSVDEFVTYAKANPTSLNYGSPGIGTLHHFTGELLKAEVGIEMQHIPYQGNGPAMTDLLAGNIQAMFIGAPLAVQYRDDATIRLLAVTSKDRDPNFPDLASLVELDHPAFEAAQSWYGVLAPAGLPADVLAKLSEASKIAAQTESVIKVAGDSGMTTVVENPEDFASEITTTSKAWADLVTATGMTFED
jgi:tripartite-type tricarboxylate transporter receptor subunit TctC